LIECPEKWWTAKQIVSFFARMHVIQMDMTQAMRVFVTVAESGSLVAAADQLDLSSAAVSRHLAALEQHLGARLLNRTTRRLSLSGAGEEFFERAQQILSEISEAETLVGSQSSQPSGLLRISVPVAFGARVLAKALPDFCSRYPKLRLDVELTDRPVDLVHDRIDVALRVAQDVAPQLIARKLAPVTLVVCAAPSYLDRRGTPATPLDLAGHETLGYTYHSLGDTWRFIDSAGEETLVRLRSNVHANNGDVLRELAVAGCGILALPTFLIKDDVEAGRLVLLLEDWSLGEFNLYAVYLSRKFLPAKIRVFIDFVVDIVRELIKADA